MPLSIKVKLIVTLLITSIAVILVPASAGAPHLVDEALKREPLLISQDFIEDQLAYDDPKRYAKNLAEDKYGWGADEFECLVTLWTKESNWRHNADNPNSSAYGIAQMLKEDEKHPAKQISNGLRYIKHRYGTPCNSWKFWRSHYWY